MPRSRAFAAGLDSSARSTLRANRNPRPDSAHVDVGNFDCVVSVAESVPGWDLGLDVAGRIDRARSERLPSDAFGLPFVPPVLPLGRAFRLLDLRWIPVAVAREADVDVRDRPRAGPRLSAHRVGALRDDRRRCWVGDADVP